MGYDSFAHPETVDAAHDDAFQTVTIDEYLRAAGVDRLDLIMLDTSKAPNTARSRAHRASCNSRQVKRPISCLKYIATMLTGATVWKTPS